MDTKFSVALHILVFISETDKVASSENLAKSVNTNSSHIRKITGLLKQAGLISSQQGKSGFSLAMAPEAIGLERVYRAVYPEKELLHVHDNPNQACPVGKHIQTLVQPSFDQAQEAFISQLANQNLADLITNLYKEEKNK